MTLARNCIAAALAASLLTACGPTVERAYSNCVDLAYKQALAGSKTLAKGNLSGIFEKAARVQAENQCKFIRDECLQGPGSEMCRRLIEQYGK